MRGEVSEKNELKGSSPSRGLSLPAPLPQEKGFRYQKRMNWKSVIASLIANFLYPQYQKRMNWKKEPRNETGRVHGCVSEKNELEGNISIVAYLCTITMV